MRHRILLVEDEVITANLLITLFEAYFGDTVKVVWKRSAAEAEAAANDPRHYAAAAFDGIVVGGSTIAAVKKFRAAGVGYPLIAISAEASLRNELLAAGCDYSCQMKYELPTLMSRLLIRAA